MRFGQKLHYKYGKVTYGRWVPYETEQQALNDGCDFVSVLELEMTVAEYEAFELKNPRGRLQIPFSGPFYADFDTRQDLEKLKQDLFKALSRICSKFRLEKEAFRIWFSGSKGFHLLLSEDAFTQSDFSHLQLPDIYQDLGIEMGLGDIMDHNVYSKGRGRLWRAGKPRKNGRRKIPLTLHQLNNLSIKDIEAMSQSQEIIPEPTQVKVKPNERLHELFDEIVADHELSARRAEKYRARKSQSTGRYPSSAPAQHYKDFNHEVQAALAQIAPHHCDDYYSWIRVGMALHYESNGEPWGLAAWDSWSRQSSKYNAVDLEQKWHAFTYREDGPTMGTIRWLARN